MDEAAIDVEQRLVFLLGDDVFFPYFVDSVCIFFYSPIPWESVAGDPIRISVGGFAERNVMKSSPMTVIPT